jgi:hypothetical protein
VLVGGHVENEKRALFTVDENEGDHDVKPDGPHGPLGF